MRTLLLIILLGMLVAVGYFAYSAISVSGEPMPTEGYVALALGAGFTVVVGIGLMMLLFLSSRRGYDEPPHSSKELSGPNWPPASKAGACR